MNKDLQSILELSVIDQEIFFLNKKKREYPAKIASLKESLLIDNSGSSLLDVKAKELAANRSSAVISLEEEREGLKKSEDKLMLIKTNEEYDAVHNEISVRKQRIAEIENRLTVLDSEMVSVDEKISVAKNKESDQEHIAMREELANLETENASLESEISKCEIRRKEIESTIGKQVLSVYMRMYNAKKTGMHVGTVTDSRRSCSICGRKLAPQRFIDVRRNSSVILCETCGSILVWQAEVTDTVVKSDVQSEVQPQNE